MNNEIPYQHKDDILAFQKEIRAVIDRAAEERDLFVVDMVGVLEMEKINLFNRIPSANLNDEG